MSNLYIPMHSVLHVTSKCYIYVLLNDPDQLLQNNQTPENSKEVLPPLYCQWKATLIGKKSQNYFFPCGLGAMCTVSRMEYHT